MNYFNISNPLYFPVIFLFILIVIFYGRFWYNCSIINLESNILNEENIMNPIENTEDLPIYKNDNPPDYICNI